MGSLAREAAHLCGAQVLPHHSRAEAVCRRARGEHEDARCCEGGECKEEARRDTRPGVVRGGTYEYLPHA